MKTLTIMPIANQWHVETWNNYWVNCSNKRVVIRAFKVSHQWGGYKWVKL